MKKPTSKLQIGSLETIKILSDKEAVRRIKKAKQEIKAGKTISLADLRRKIERARPCL